MTTYVLKARDGRVVAGIVAPDQSVDLRDIENLLGSGFTLAEPTWAEVLSFNDANDGSLSRDPPKKWLS